MEPIQEVNPDNLKQESQETSTDLMKKGIGDKEKQKVKPEFVEIIDVDIVEVGDKKNRKVECSCKHPDLKDPIKISSTMYILAKNIKESGLWVNIDEDGKLQKGSALAITMEKFGASNIEGLKGLRVPTDLGSKDFLCFKAY